MLYISKNSKSSRKSKNKGAHSAMHFGTCTSHIAMPTLMWRCEFSKNPNEHQRNCKIRSMCVRISTSGCQCSENKHQTCTMPDNKCQLCALQRSTVQCIAASAYDKAMHSIIQFRILMSMELIDAHYYTYRWHYAPRFIAEEISHYLRSIIEQTTQSSHEISIIKHFSLIGCIWFN